MVLMKAQRRIHQQKGSNEGERGPRDQLLCSKWLVCPRLCVLISESVLDPGCPGKILPLT